MQITHIPKVGGFTLFHELAISNITVWSDSYSSETCFRTWYQKGRVNVVVLRKPVEHVVSMFRFCREDDHGRRSGFQTSSFFLKNVKNVSFEEGLSRWVDHYLLTPHSDLGCYNPVNLQTRALVCNRRGAAASHRFDPTPLTLDVALDSLASAEVVGTLKSIPQVLCLIHAAVGRRERQCSSDVTVDTHGHVPSTRVHSVLSLSTELRRKMHQLTYLDERVYSAASRRLRQDWARFRSKQL